MEVSDNLSVQSNRRGADKPSTMKGRSLFTTPLAHTYGISALYDKKFFQEVKAHSLSSAKEIVPLVLEFLRPTSVVDVGCGIGTWLSVFQEHHVTDVLGIDGPHLDLDALLFPKNCFLPHELTRPLKLDRQFDLVLSLEVAEHLPPSTSEAFVDTLTHLGPVVLFSAAIPFQGGKNHINERWQDYWSRLFEFRDYLAIDYLRSKVWNNKRVGFWYAQNTLLYAHRDFLKAHPHVAHEREKTGLPLAVVHPQLYEYRTLTGPVGMKKMLLAMPRLILKALLRRWIS